MNHIYFTRPITKRSIYRLGKTIDKMWCDYEKLKIENRHVDIIAKPIYLHLNTIGGCATSGWVGASLIKSAPFDISTIIEGTCCSAGTIMSVVGKKRYIEENSFMMIHQLSGGCSGTYKQMKDTMNFYKKNMHKSIIHYEKYSTMNKTEIRRRLKSDDYLDANSAIKCGLVDEIWNRKN